jgi:hypothetical protein
VLIVEQVRKYIDVMCVCVCVIIKCAQPQTCMCGRACVNKSVVFIPISHAQLRPLTGLCTVLIAIHGLRLFGQIRVRLIHCWPVCVLEDARVYSFVQNSLCVSG